MLIFVISIAKATLITNGYSEEKRKKRMKRFCRKLPIVFILVALAAAIIFMFCAYQNSNSNRASFDSPEVKNWEAKTYAIKSYDAVKKNFDDQKQAIVDAYNAQVDKISTFGLKTNDDFNGLKFKNNIFKNNLSSLKNTINANYESTAFDPDNNRDSREASISKMVDKLDSSVSEKMAKIKAFYDAKINKIYDCLKNGQKVNFDSVKDYNGNSKAGDFNHKDFNSIGSSLVREDILGKNANNESFCGALAGMSLAALIFTAGMALLYSD